MKDGFFGRLRLPQNDSTRENTPRRLLAVALGLPTTADARRAMAALAGRADAVELRLDLMAEYDLPELLRGSRDSSLGVVVTNRPLREGGRFAGSEAERARPLFEAADLGAEYVDVEGDAPDLLDALARRRGGHTHLIASSHDFAAMPPDLPERRRRLAESGADVAKVVGTARSLLDNLPVLRALREATSPTIAIAMGAPGLISRVLCLRSDSCLLTFAAPDDAGGTAPGQIPLSSLVATYRAREIGPATLPYGVLSLAPTRDETNDETIARLNASTRDEGRDAVWVPLVAETPAEAAGTARGLFEAGFAGYLVAPSARGALGLPGSRLGSDEYFGVRPRVEGLDVVGAGGAEEVARTLVEGRA
jgi:3-dehydroquinate dehydratase type I